MKLATKLSVIKNNLIESIENTLPEIEIIKDKISSMRDDEIKQRPAKYEIIGMTANICFKVHVEDLKKYYRNGYVFISKDNRR